MFSIRRHIPNFITSLNLACGVVGIVYTAEGRVDLAFAFMLFAAVCDFFDGFAARLLKAYSPMGKELDSLADEVSFGVLPAVMLYTVMRECTFSNSPWCLLCLIVAVFAGLRLAKFNVDESQKNSFKGLAAPVSALLAGSLSYYIAAEPTSVPALLGSTLWFLPLVSVLLSALMICPLPCFSFKFHKTDSRGLKIKRISFIVETVIILLIVSAVHTNVSLAILLACLLYILKNLTYTIFRV